ncbi:MAG TPA: hypothetical protein VIX59_03380 [Candidatus Binataceae bacterium]
MIGVLDRWEDLSSLVDEMKFSLQFKGSLHSDQSKDSERRKREKQDIREVLHKQLVRKWIGGPGRLAFIAGHGFHYLPFRGQQITGPDGRHWPQDPDWAIIKRTTPTGKDLYFLPTVIRASRISLVCELDIRLFWRERRQGGIFRSDESGLDLDNRLTALLDALTVPNANQLPDDIDSRMLPQPCLVLLENDNLIVQVKIRATPLVSEPAPSEGDAHIEAYIDVEISGGDLGEPLE